jgi:hypothetical protein
MPGQILKEVIYISPFISTEKFTILPISKKNTQTELRDDSIIRLL